MTKSKIDNLIDRKNVKWLPLSEIIYSLNTGLNPRKFFQLNTDNAHNYYVTIKEMRGGKIIFNNKTDRISDEAMRLCQNRSNLDKGDVLFSGTGTIGVTVLVNEKPKNWNIKEGVYAIKPKQDIILSAFLNYLLNSKNIRQSYSVNIAGSTVQSIQMKDLKNMPIPIPPISEQKRIVNILDKFDALTQDLQAGLPAEIAAREKQYGYYCNKLLTFKQIAEA
jgi:type I restriction enzyme S subunit